VGYRGRTVAADARAPLIPPIRVLVTTADKRVRVAVARTLAAKASVRVDTIEGGETVAAARTLDYDVVVLDAEIASGELAPPLLDALASRAAARRQAVEASIAAESQRIARQKFTSVFNASPAPMFVAEIDSGVILEVNPAFAELTGYPVEALIGFFTTKDRDRGVTGLGLAMVYGAVKQRGGSIWVYSEPGIGTTFKIYLPIVERPATTGGAGEEVVRSLRGTETILVVEDRDDVRRFIREALERHGYTVIEAASPRETLGLMPTIGDRVQLLVTDVVLPQMSGRRLAHLCHDLYPLIRVLYMSGYAPGAGVAHGGLEPAVAYIQKPLETQTLLEKVRAVLDDPTPPPV
jgi:DNA-binding response OmpR family regulator